MHLRTLKLIHIHTQPDSEQLHVGQAKKPCGYGTRDRQWSSHYVNRAVVSFTASAARADEQCRVRIILVTTCYTRYGNKIFLLNKRYSVSQICCKKYTTLSEYRLQSFLAKPIRSCLFLLDFNYLLLSTGTSAYEIMDWSVGRHQNPPRLLAV